MSFFVAVLLIMESLFDQVESGAKIYNNIIVSNDSNEEDALLNSAHETGNSSDDHGKDHGIGHDGVNGQSSNKKAGHLRHEAASGGPSSGSKDIVLSTSGSKTKIVVRKSRGSAKKSALDSYRKHHKSHHERSHCSCKKERVPVLVPFCPHSGHHVSPYGSSSYSGPQSRDQRGPDRRVDDPLLQLRSKQGESNNNVAPVLPETPFSSNSEPRKSSFPSEQLDHHENLIRSWMTHHPDHGAAVSTPFLDPGYQVTHNPWLVHDHHSSSSTIHPFLHAFLSSLEQQRQHQHALTQQQHYRHLPLSLNSRTSNRVVSDEGDKRTTFFDDEDIPDLDVREDLFDPKKTQSSSKDQDHQFLIKRRQDNDAFVSKSQTKIKQPSPPTLTLTLPSTPETTTPSTITSTMTPSMTPSTSTSLSMSSSSVTSSKRSMPSLDWLKNKSNEVIKRLSLTPKKSSSSETEIVDPEAEIHEMLKD